MKVRKNIIALICLVFAALFSLNVSVYADDNIANKTTLYPISVEEAVDGGHNIITKTYALSPTDDPKLIPSDSFEKYGATYTVSDVIKKDNQVQDLQDHTEPVSITTTTNDLNSVIKQLDPTMKYDKDGYNGDLTLDLSSIKCVVAGYKTSSYTATRTRTYPGLSSNDTSQVPKSIVDGGVIYAIKNLKFTAASEDSIDSESMPTGYIATATYSASLSSKNATGYTTTANYVGKIKKIYTDKIIYSVIFTGDAVAAQTPEPTPVPSPTPVLLHKSMGNVLGILLRLILVLAIIGGLIMGSLFLLSYNVVIFNKSGREYVKIGSIRLNLKDSTIDLNQYAAKLQSKHFVIQISKLALKKVAYDDIFIILGDEQKTHIIDRKDHSDKYQFEISFEDAKNLKGELFYE